MPDETVLLTGKTKNRLNSDTMPIENTEALLSRALKLTGKIVDFRLNRYSESCIHVVNYLRCINVVDRVPL